MIYSMYTLNASNIKETLKFNTLINVARYKLVHEHVHVCLIDQVIVE